MEKKGYSREGFFGETIHYDADGNKIGESRKNFTGGYDHFNADGNKVGSSHKSFTGGMTHYDDNGEKIGSSNRGFLGQTNHYDAQGAKVGESIRNFTGGQNHYSTNADGRQSCKPEHETHDSRPPQYNSSEAHSMNGFDELLAALAAAGFVLFILGVLLRWENILLYFIVFIISLGWFIIRNK